jgi:hypothetical protein
MNIDWTPPQPRGGKLGALDKFVGPGATIVELALQFGVAAALAAVMFVLALRADYNWGIIQYAVFLIFALDLVGGVITNATSAAKRWYHRAGQGMVPHFGFVALHGVHLLILALVFRSMDWTFFAAFYAYLLATAFILLITPLYIQRALAMAFFCGAVVAADLVFTPTPGMGWFIPLFFAKLLISHLTREAPFRPEHEVKP